ncbi:iron export ABC transporter permease subunit FetB [Fictibacillus sp. KIGAM418]|uniref:Iron export ABC transporter permease subunit FetB n=1 Tax=Fictibacillus marinisediminis TaxID=2878389 RepID=A0A9X1XFB0_9BACL|nr:iron export ABC transporter permease subunit FetB [Fictibacillus marinisediminis]MCK6258533.1 iron export ABC transporter permease subunit FetB [Fictibacillus marinisediminis]
MKDKVIDISLWQLLSAYLFIVILTIIVKWRGIAREKEIVIGTLRMTIQLVLAGYVLTYLLKHPHPALTVLILVLMEGFAVYNVFKRIKHELSPSLKKVVALSMTIGTLISLLFFNYVVIQFSPWYEPRYVIPIAGMIIGNAMTGVTLGVNHLVEGMEKQKHMVEAALMLGASPKAATKELVDLAFDSAILPTINSMVGMGIIFLPGMMTGQILSGISPITAIEYQIAIMLGIAGSVAFSVIIFVQYGYRTFFNERAQLK